MYDIIIVGAGPAGLTAAIYAKRANKSVLVIENKSYGGQIINTFNIENYPALMHVDGFSLADKMYNQAKELGTEFIFENVLEIKNGKTKKVITNKKEYVGKTIILATGCDNRKLGIDNEENLVGKGISYCATCDGAFYKGKIVFVVGGGNTALEDALYLSDIASIVYLIHRRDTFRADGKTVNLLKAKDNVKFIYNSNVTKLVGINKLKEIQVTNINGKKQNFELDGLFIAIGKNPKNDCFKKIIKLDEKGYVLSKENCHTNLKGVFVAGDVRKKSIRQLVTAVSDGAIAATEAINYLENN